jgi:DNA polymerase-1
MQTLPRDPIMRSLVTAQPGGALISADYSAIELRLLAMLAPEERMRAAFAAGDDLHRLFAAKLTGRGPSDVTGPERTSAKIANFLLGYGGGAYTLQQNAIREYDFFWTMEETQRIYDAYHEQWPGLFANYYPAVAEELKRDARVRSLTGRIRHLPEINGYDTSKREGALRQAINFKVQSLAGDLALSACHLAQDAGLPLVGFVHDSIMLDVPTPPDHPETLLTAERLRVIMSEEAPAYLTKHFGIEWTVSFPVEVKIGETWS